LTRVRFTCPNCDRPLAATAKSVGRRGKCPGCDAAISVPGSGDGEDSEGAVNPVDAGDVARTADQNSYRPPAVEGKVAAGGAAVESRVVEPGGLLGAGSAEHSEFAIYDDDEFVIDYDTQETPVAPAEARRVVISRQCLYMQGAMLPVLALVCFAIGYLAGSTRIPDHLIGPVVRQPSTLGGTVSCRNSMGGAFADEGAVVVLLPCDRQPSSKIAVTGLEPGSKEATAQIDAISRIREVGGGYATVDSSGQFSIPLPDVGEYYVLVISNRNRHNEGQQLDYKHLAQMGRYFLASADLVAQRQYKWLAIEMQADKTTRILFE